jgi:hypothetical protein
MSDNVMSTDTIKEMVRARYGSIAASADASCCASAPTSCCGETAVAPDLNAKARGVGYSDDELAAVPEGGNLGLGCGNPLAIASMKAGEVIVDLGSGAGSIASWHLAGNRRDADACRCNSRIITISPSPTKDAPLRTERHHHRPEATDRLPQALLSAHFEKIQSAHLGSIQSALTPAPALSGWLLL